MTMLLHIGYHNIATKYLHYRILIPAKGFCNPWRFSREEASGSWVELEGISAVLPREDVGLLASQQDGSQVVAQDQR
jgi:hypothetical protein